MLRRNEIIIRTVCYPILRIFWVILMQLNNFFGYKTLTIVYIVIVYIYNIYIKDTSTDIIDIFRYISQTEMLVLFWIFLYKPMSYTGLPLVLICYYAFKELTNYIIVNIIIKHCKTTDVCIISHYFYRSCIFDRFLFILSLIILPWLIYLYCLYMFTTFKLLHIPLMFWAYYLPGVILAGYFNTVVFWPIFSGRLGFLQLHYTNSLILIEGELYTYDSKKFVTWYRVPLFWCKVRIPVKDCPEGQYSFKLSDRERIFLLITSLHCFPIPYINMFSWY
jgi:hypothetical protein